MSSPGSKFCSISSGAALKWVRNWRSATARSASGRRSAKSTQAPASNAAGPGAREQRCWVHKTGNVLNKLPKGLQKKAKGRLQDIWMAETRKDAESAFDFFLEAYGPKYDKAAACLAKDRDVLLTFYDFPAEHWKHVRTTNPIESTFATVRLRTYRTKGCLSRKTAMAMVFKLCQCAQRKWRKLDGSNHLAEIIRGVKFVDGERQDRAAA